MFVFALNNQCGDVTAARRQLNVEHGIWALPWPEVSGGLTACWQTSARTPKPSTHNFKIDRTTNI